MTNVQTRKNEYDHTVADCPFCDGWVYLRPSTKVSPDQLRDLKRHIITAAKNEAFAIAIKKDVAEAIAQPHVDYIRDHYDWRPQRNGTLKRQFDNDLRIQP